MIRMQLSRILIRELMDYQVIELREVLDDLEGDVAHAKPRMFPIVIGLPEAQAIERRLAGIEIKRPQTHDLLASVVEALGAELFAIEIHDLADNTFFARLRLRAPGGDEVEVDSRPSDAIALGVATGVPIFVAEHVIDAATATPVGEDDDAGSDDDSGIGPELDLDDDDDEDEGPF
ncbi:MAG: bifunctional nuclease family protein [Planctomycetota bacterium]